MARKIIIGTRSSKLALWQANYVKNELGRLCPDLEIHLKEIKTKGDYITDTAIFKIGGKGIFTKEIEDSLLTGESDLAIHSLKDLPTKLPEGLKIAAVLKRENPHDVLISKGSIIFKDLPLKARIGTSSLRRIAQLRALRNDLEYPELRGNIDTRIKKLDSGEYDAIVLAYAGVKRLGFENRITENLNPADILPAVGQGAIAVEIRANDKELEEYVLKLNDNETFLISVLERSFLETLQGGCQVPAGTYTNIEGNRINSHVMIASLDGVKVIKNKFSCDLEINICKNTGIKAAQWLLQNGGKEILEKLRI